MQLVRNPYKFKIKATAELIVSRANSEEANMGLTNFAGSFVLLRGGEPPPLN